MGAPTMNKVHVLARPGAPPLYHQIAAVFRQRIEDGIWSPGDRLPSLDSLMQEFSVARVTIREAMKLLREEGLLLPERGRGTVVTRRASTRRPLRVETTLADLIEIYRGDRPDVENIEEGFTLPKASEEEGRLAEDYFHMRRVHTRDGTRYCVISLYIDASVFRREEQRFRSELVLPVLFALPDLAIAHARQRVTIAKCDAETAAMLDYPFGDPVAKVRRILTRPDDSIIYIADVVYRGDCIRFDMDMKP